MKTVVESGKGRRMQIRLGFWRRFEAELIRLRRCATRVDPRAQMLPRGMHPASLMRVSQTRRSGCLVWAVGRFKFSRE